MQKVSKGINFIPEFVVKEKARRKKMVTIAAITAIITLFSFCIYVIPEWYIYSLNTKKSQTTSKINNMREVKELKAKQDDLKTKMDSKKKILEDIRKKENDIVAITNKLASALPKNVLLDNFTITGGNNVNANFVINTPEEIVALTNNLKGLNIFEKVEMPSVPIVDRKMNISFKLKLTKNIPVAIPEAAPVVAPQTPPQAAPTVTPEVKPAVKEPTPAPSTKTTKSTTVKNPITGAKKTTK